MSGGEKFSRGRARATRMLRAGVAAALAFGPTAGRVHGAEPAAEATPRERADALVREAAACGAANDWDCAIAAFRKAEAVYPRATHDCNIGLAFMRSARPHLAWLYLGRCQGRTTDALPPWVDAMRRDALAAMRSGGFAPIEVTTTPPVASVTVDTLPDERLTPTGGTLSLWLPQGVHTLRVSAPGHLDEVREVTVAGQETSRVVIELKPVPAEPPPEPRTPPVRPELAPIPEVRPDVPPAGGVAQDDAREVSTTSWLVLGGGAAFFAGGLVALGFALDTAATPQRERIPAGPAFDALREEFKLQHTVWVAMGLAGGILTAAGATMAGFDLWADRPGRVSLVPARGGGALTLGGTF
jgi:hypothetical protein